MNARLNVLRHIYLNQLFYYPSDVVKRFWLENRFAIEGCQVSDHELFTALWKGRRHTEGASFFSLLSNLEKFCIDQGTSLPDFYLKVLCNTGHYSTYPGDELVAILEPFLNELIQNREPLGVAAPIFSSLIRYEIPDSYVSLLHHEKREDKSRAIMRIHIPDKEECSVSLDMDVWCCMIIQNSPLSFNLPPYSGVVMRADRRPLHRIATQWCTNRCLDITVKENIIMNKGDIVGTVVRFSRHLATLGLDMDQFPAIADVLVCMISKDLYCSCRKRFVLRNGCVYGAPVHIFEIWNNNNDGLPARFLRHIANNLQKMHPLIMKVKDKHRMILRSCQNLLVVHYSRIHDRLFINSKPFVKGYQAKLMRKIVMDYVSSRKNEFTYDDFKLCAFCNLDVKHPALTIHLQRIDRKLKHDYPSLRIQWSSRGRIAFFTDAEITWHEN